MTTDLLVNYYEILELAPTATQQEVEAAIQRQYRVWFKRQQSPSQEKRQQAEVRVRQLDEARSILLDPSQRASYDARLGSYVPPAASGAAGPSVEGSVDWLVRARQYLDAGDAHSAAYAARQATDQYGANDMAWAVRGETSMMLGRVQDAVFEYNEALRINPSAPQYHYDLGAVWESAGDWPKALSEYQQASSLAPQEPAYRLAIACVFIQNDLEAQALPILETLWKENEGNQVIAYYYALALDGEVVNGMTLLSDGTRVFTNGDQVDWATGMLAFALSLPFDDAQVRGVIENRQSYVAKQKDLKWSLGFGATVAFVLVILVLGGMMGSAGGIGGLLTLIIWGGGGFLLFSIARQPQWKIIDKQTRGLQVRAWK